MPSKSAKQHRLMAAVAHNPAFAKKAGIPVSVGKDFTEADKGKKFGMGGSPKITRGGEGMINKQETRRGSMLGYQKGVPDINLNKFEGMKKGGTVKHDDEAEDKKLIKKAFGMHDKQLHESKKTDLSKLKKGGKIMAKAKSDSKSMGSVPTAAPSKDGIAQRGKTKGKQIVMSGNKGMKKGGKC